VNVMLKSRSKTIDIDLEENYFFKEIEESENNDKKYFVLIIYDISSNKKRNRMVKILKSYGFRVQKSAFEAMLRPDKYKKLLVDIKNIPESTDSVRVYKILGTGTIEVYGEQYSIEDEETVVI